MDYQPYEEAEITMGKVNEATVWVTFMPRADFLECVEQTFVYDAENGTYYPESFKNKMRTTAQFMDVFAMNDWINEWRGCGCVVGEYLVAHDLLKREDVVSGDVSVIEVLREQEDFLMLDLFGTNIDAMVGYFLGEHDVNRVGLDAVVILD